MGRGFEGRMIFECFEDRIVFEVLLLNVSRQEKSMALFDPDIFFDELRDPNLDGGCSFGQFTNPEEEEQKDG